MKKKILLATTGSPASFGAARVAFEMAKRYDAELLLFHVAGVPKKGFSYQEVSDVRSQEAVSVDEDYMAWVEEELKTTYAKQLEECKNSRILLATGLPHREILRAARSEDVDMIIMGAHSGDSSAVYSKGYPGSTLQRVAKAAKCPVMTVHRESASYMGGFSHIVFATDFSKQSESAFKYALSMAKEFDCEMTLFHALDITSKVLAQSDIEDKLISLRKRLRDVYGPKMGEFKNFEVDVWEGNPYVEIVKIARERMADLIVLAHNTRDLDPEQASMGSTLEQVILRANCPVVSVNRPDKV